MRFRRCRVALLVILPALVVAAAERSAEENYKQHCVECHGRDGKSQTRLGRKSGAKDLSSRENQAKLTDEDAFNGIKHGRKNSKGEEKMEAFGDRLSDKEITALVAYVRSLAK
jgi:mono/diheme cytochrome c family protein